MKWHGFNYPEKYIILIQSEVVDIEHGHRNPIDIIKQRFVGSMNKVPITVFQFLWALVANIEIGIVIAIASATHTTDLIIWYPVWGYHRWIALICRVPQQIDGVNIHIYIQNELIFAIPSANHTVTQSISHPAWRARLRYTSIHHAQHLVDVHFKGCIIWLMRFVGGIRHRW